MGIVCPGEFNERTWGKVTYLVEQEVEGAFMASHNRPGIFDYPVFLWIPDPVKGDKVYLFPEDSEISLAGTNIGMARIEKGAIGPKARMTMGEGLEEVTMCCFPTAISLRSVAGENGTISRVHKVGASDFPTLPSIAVRYNHQQCEGGKVVEFDGDYLEPLHCGGCFTGDQGVYLLWLDEDAKARGWEKVTSLVGVDLNSRFGIRGMHLFTLAPDFTEFLGFDESEEVQEFERRVRTVRRPRRSLSM